MAILLILFELIVGTKINTTAAVAAAANCPGRKWNKENIGRLFMGCASVCLNLVHGVVCVVCCYRFHTQNDKYILLYADRHRIQRVRYSIALSLSICQTHVYCTTYTYIWEKIEFADATVYYLFSPFSVDCGYYWTCIGIITIHRLQETTIFVFGIMT